MTTATTIKERPILFTGEMVRAILDGRKTQTRRVCKEATQQLDGPAASVHPDGSKRGWIAWWPSAVSAEETARLYPGDEGFRCPYGQAGDRLWVREAVLFHPANNWLHRVGMGRRHYVADLSECELKARKYEGWRARPSIHLPRWASRLTLEITNVRVERLQAITPEDAIAEGVDLDPTHYTLRIDDQPCEMLHVSPVYAYGVLWNSINGKTHPWLSNPWVWVVEFKRIEPES